MVVQVFVYDQQWLLVGDCSSLLLKYIFAYIFITKSAMYVLIEPLPLQLLLYYSQVIQMV